MTDLHATNKWMRAGLITAFIILLLDQASKWAMLSVVQLPNIGTIPVTSFFDLTMVWNRGVSMGFLAAEGDLGRWLLVIMTALVTGWLFFWLQKAARRMEGLAIGAIIGGAIGNIIDRVIHGAVADFLHFFYEGYSFYVFNVADAAISVGVGFLLLDGLMAGKGKSEAE